MSVNYNPRIVTDNLIFCLDAGNVKSYPGSGITWTDLSGRGKNGTLVNMEIEDYINFNGGYLNFDGSNEYVNTTLSHDISSGFTFTFWFYGTKDSVHFIASYFLDADSNTVFRVERFSAGNDTIEFGHSPDGGSIGANELTSTNFPNNVWTCCTLKYDGDYKYIYKNGVLDSTSASGQTFSNYSGATLRIAARQDGSLLPFSGYLSHISMYNRSLSDSEILQNFNALKNRYGF